MNGSIEAWEPCGPCGDQLDSPGQKVPPTHVGTSWGEVSRLGIVSKGGGACLSTAEEGFWERQRDMERGVGQCIHLS